MLKPGSWFHSLHYSSPLLRGRIYFIRFSFSTHLAIPSKRHIPRLAPLAPFLQGTGGWCGGSSLPVRQQTHYMGVYYKSEHTATTHRRGWRPSWHEKFGPYYYHRRQSSHQHSTTYKLWHSLFRVERSSCSSRRRRSGIHGVFPRSIHSIEYILICPKAAYKDKEEGSSGGSVMYWLLSTGSSFFPHHQLSSISLSIWHRKMFGVE